MSTIVNNTNPAPVSSTAPTPDEGGNGFMIGAVVLLIIVVLLFVFFGIPALRGTSSVQVNVPAQQGNTPTQSVATPSVVNTTATPISQVTPNISVTP